MKVENMDKEEKKHDVSGVRNRSCSPLSQDFKSQDSGFSDSERSDCSKTYENATPRRKLRRKRMKHRIQSMGTTSSWLEEECSPIPTHTSTPKDSRLFVSRNCFGKSANSSSREHR